MSAFPLRPARVHEAYGPAAHGFALLAASKTGGTVLWLQEAWQKAELLPEALAAFYPPEQILLAHPASATDLLAVAEEALKDGAISAVVLEITTPLNLREGRRLQLAARAGGSLGLCLIANETIGSNAAETRWHCTPLYDPQASDSTLMHWQLKKNKSGTLGAWYVRCHEATHHIDLVAAPAV